MSRILTGIFTGMFMGVYFAERQLPFPLKYNKRPDNFGSLELDLSVLSTITDDVRGLIGQAKNTDKSDSHSRSGG